MRLDLNLILNVEKAITFEKDSIVKTILSQIYLSQNMIKSALNMIIDVWML